MSSLIICFNLFSATRWTLVVNNSVLFCFIKKKESKLLNLYSPKLFNQKYKLGKKGSLQTMNRKRPLSVFSNSRFMHLTNCVAIAAAN